MGTIHQPNSVLLIIAAFSRHEAALDWARAKCEAEWGPVMLESERFAFVETDYYAASMGEQLRKLFWVFERQIDAATLPQIKHATNDWEAEIAASRNFEEQRPLNLDPGYLTLAKLVLASTKDHAHRIYLGDGIYGEVTLSYRHKTWQKYDWTFPDYQRADYHAFFSKCRELIGR